MPTTAPSLPFFKRNRSYRVRNRFAFGAVSQSGAVALWGGTTAGLNATIVVATGAVGTANSAAAFAALTASGHVAAWGTAAYIRNVEVY
jgi:hypothetical protein